jgi:Tfp pilus tip-associated adhesin PilY1
MRTKIFRALLTVILLGFLMAGVVHATTVPEGEEALFTNSVAPDALIVLDLSGSMLLPPPGDTLYIGSSETCKGSGVAHYSTSGATHTKTCTFGAYDTVIPRYSNSSCTGPFYTSSQTGYTTECRRVNIARRALFDVLDDNDDNTINSTDETSLGVRIGYMRFTDGDDTAAVYSSGNNKLIRSIGSKYSLVYCASNSSCTLSSTASSASIINSNDWPNSGTPLVSSLNEANLYLAYDKDNDTAGGCRQKFVLLVSDGADTYSCSGSGSEAQTDQYKRRRESVAKAKALKDAGYRVFVVGFGAGMPAYLQNSLNWMAYYGGTDNPNEANVGSTSGYDPSTVTACGTSTTTTTCNDTDGDTGAGNCATANDPATAKLRGYAFLAADADQLAHALKSAINIIREATYSFSQSSIQSSRTQDENFIYEGSFQPVDGDPFWLGHFKKYQINDDGTVGTQLWDAGELLRDRTDGGTTLRNILTYKAGALVEFKTENIPSGAAAANITAADLGVTTTTERDNIVAYFRGSATPDNWKLGDVFRATPITVGAPSAYFDDTRDTAASPNAFSQHRTNQERNSLATTARPTPRRIVLAGANDGQLHAFKTGTGAEAWSFIPPNLLSRLKLVAHTSHPSTLAHQYYVDGPVTVADVWTPATASDGTSKQAVDWHTLLVFAEARGAGTNLWSSSTSCDSGFSGIYSSTTPYYCGYYALDLSHRTSTGAVTTVESNIYYSSLNPQYKWILGGTGTTGGFSSTTGPYMGAPWSKMLTGRVVIGGNERWVGFIGGGAYSAGAADSGKGFFVIDLYDGKILWSYTKSTNSSMDNPLPAPPATVDTDNDGFIDTVYIGDLGSNMWRFKFPCKIVDGSTCGTANWVGGRLFEANASSGIRPIYTTAAVAKDNSGNLWVYWGTGDKTDPTAPNAQEKFFGLMDNDRSSTRTIGEMDNITNEDGYYSTPGKYGYYINLSGQGEKMLSDPTVFGGVVYFTTYTPPKGTDPCEQGGEASLYGLNFKTGAGALPITDSPRSMSIGSGIPSAPVVSLKPSGGTTPDLYITASGGGGIGAQTQRANINPPGMANRTNMLYWKDKRVEP